ncbi:MAG: hypothetical protein IV100_04655 [Myxococcales bacterium]|nr:hypothetical protein [Myxococcales bacterium]
MTIKDLKEIMDSTSDAAVLIDGDGVVTAINAACVALLGAGRAVVGRQCHELFAGTSEVGKVCEADCCVLGAVHAGRPLRNFDMQVNTTTGRQWCNVTVLHSGSRTRPWALNIFRVVDVRKRLEMLVRDFVATTTGLDQEMASKVLAHGRPALQVSLTSQEQKVLKLLSRGESTAGVAKELGISPTTAANHIQRAMVKLSAHTRLDAVRRAQHAGII